MLISLQMLMKTKGLKPKILDLEEHSRFHRLSFPDYFKLLAQGGAVIVKNSHVGF